MIATVAERMKDPNTDRAKKSASVFLATMLGRADDLPELLLTRRVSNEMLVAGTRPSCLLGSDVLLL